MRPHPLRRGLLAAATAALAAALLAACAAPPPLLRLPPAALGTTLAQRQRLTVTTAGRAFTLDAVLEADTDAVRWAVLQFDQPVARLAWDGTALQAWYAPQWPAALAGERMLSDLQLALWPADAVRAVLPPGWRLHDDGRVRELQRGDAVEVRIDRIAPGRSRLSQRRLGYRIDIDSQTTEPP